MHGHHAENKVSCYDALALRQASIDVSLRNQIRESFHMNTNTDIDKTGFEQELAQHIITALNLDIGLAEIDPLAPLYGDCLLYTSDAADDLLCVDLGGRRIIKK